MDPNSKVIPLHLHPLGFIESFTHFGADLETLLEGTDINRNMFEQRDVKISYVQQQRLLNNGVKLCNTPGLGLMVGDYFDWSYHGTVGGIMQCAPSLKEAGAALRRYLLMAQPYYCMYVKKPYFFVDSNGLFTNPIRDFATLNNDPDVLTFEMEFRISQTTKIWDACGNKSVPNPAIHLRINYPEPFYGDLYREILPAATITFGCEELSISAHYLFVTEPWRQFRKNAFQRIIDQCEEEFQRTEIEPSYTEKVRWHIYLDFFDANLSLEKISEIMSLSPRALTRKLAHEGTSFRNILHEVKMELTATHLRSSHLSVDAIAELMGFSSASSLRRAIKNWSGNAAGEFRGDVVPMRKRA